MIKKLLIILIAFLLLTFCCKEEEQINEFPSLIGPWDIIQIDSCYQVSGNYEPLPFIISSFQEKGSIVFNKDSTGFFADPIRSITCGETNFSWRHNKIDGQIGITLSNGITRCYIKTFKRDTVEFFINDYCNKRYVGVGFLYYMKLIKTK